MRLYYLIAILLIRCSHLWADECHHKLGQLGDTQGKFVHCATKKAVPVQLCIGCLPEFKGMVKSYDALVGDTNCSKEFFDQDRINIISTTQSILVGLWTKAYCEDCFTNNHFVEFEKRFYKLYDCLNKTVVDKCLHCLSAYTDLNDYYKQWDGNNTGKVCFDSEDQMNITRKHWSKDLQCCKRTFKMTLFLSISSIMLVLPIVFYSSLYAYGKRREQIHDVLNNEVYFYIYYLALGIDAETTSEAPNSSPSALPIQSETGASTSNNTRHNLKHRNKLQNNDVTADSTSEESDGDDDLRKKL